MTMREKVARAIHAVMDKHCGEPCKFYDGCGCAQCYADAALLALETPDEGMVEAAMRMMDTHPMHSMDGFCAATPAAAKDILAAAIRAARTGKGTKG